MTAVESKSTPSDPSTTPATPTSKLTLRVRRDVLLDRLAQRVSTRLASKPNDVLIERVGLELSAASALWRERGWIDNPESYHPEPPAPEGVRTSRTRSGAYEYDSVTWVDGYEPHEGEPGRARWMSYDKNHLARLAVMRHRGKDRPWIICVHGWGMGMPRLDLRAFKAKHLHQGLGCNVASLTLPLHGRRRPDGVGRMSGFPSADLLDTVHGFAQATWDVRQIVTWLRGYTEQPIGLMGISLGGYTTALVSSIDDRFAVAIPMVPVADIATVMAEHADAAPENFAPLVEHAREVLAPVSPLHLEPKVPLDRRLIVAGTLDQFARASTQASVLHRHWDDCELKWFHGAHVGFGWARGVQETVDEHLRRHGLAKPRRR